MVGTRYWLLQINTISAKLALLLPMIRSNLVVYWPILSTNRSSIWFGSLSWKKRACSVVSVCLIRQNDTRLLWTYLGRLWKLKWLRNPVIFCSVFFFIIFICWLLKFVSLARSGQDKMAACLLAFISKLCQLRCLRRDKLDSSCCWRRFEINSGTIRFVHRLIGTNKRRDGRREKIRFAWMRKMVLNSFSPFVCLSVGPGVCMFANQAVDLHECKPGWAHLVTKSLFLSLHVSCCLRHC